MEDYIFIQYLENPINKIQSKYNVVFAIDIDKNSKLKKADKIRIETNSPATLDNLDVYEIVFLKHLEKLYKYSSYNDLKSEEKKKKCRGQFLFHYYTLFKLSENTICLVNRHVKLIITLTLDAFKDIVKIADVVNESVLLIEKNPSLIKYEDMRLYNHQKDIFRLFGDGSDNLPSVKSRLAFYIAPTGTGKTITPIGLSEKYKIIFVCAARHVGLALARSAISVGKKVAFGFGCETADDIRLHYSAAKVFTKHRKTGGKFKIDNSVGDDVEIIISDIQSYVPCMHYMKAFNDVRNIILYWDEPTITMDYNSHPMHEIIQKNWIENIIPNVVLSSATLPKMHELNETVDNFKHKFENSLVLTIEGNDCKKTIPLINKDGFVVMPHYLCESYDDILKMAEHINNNKSLLRYLDFKEVIKFIDLVNTTNVLNVRAQMKRHIVTLDDVSMDAIKRYYIVCLQNILSGTWGSVYLNLKCKRELRLVDNIPSPQKKSNVVNITTRDAYTLTDGPTIYLAEDVEKIALFLIQQAEIPKSVMDELLTRISFNNMIGEKMHEKEKELDFLESKMSESQSDNDTSKIKNCRKLNRMDGNSDVGVTLIKKLSSEITELRLLIKTASLNDTFVPNKRAHQAKWCKNSACENAFTSDVDEDIITDIMQLHGVDNMWKLLLMMGIGVFTNHKSAAYVEIMKKLANTQKLYLIIATSDYIYGTNYQFCHAYIAKDLSLTQEKIIQAMGRVGRNNIQQNYTIRFRNDGDIHRLFNGSAERPEVEKMNRLFNPFQL